MPRGGPHENARRVAHIAGPITPASLSSNAGLGDVRATSPNGTAGIPIGPPDEALWDFLRSVVRLGYGVELGVRKRDHARLVERGTLGRDGFELVAERSA